MVSTFHYVVGSEEVVLPGGDDVASAVRSRMQELLLGRVGLEVLERRSRECPKGCVVDVDHRHVAYDLMVNDDSLLWSHLRDKQEVS